MDNAVIRVCVFLIATMVVSLPAVGLALASLFTHRRMRRLSAVALLLLFSDMAELTMSLSIVRSLLGSGVFCGQHTLLSLKSPLILLSCRLCGLYLHQLVAIEGASLLKNPRSSAQLFSHFCSASITTVCVLIFVMFIAVKGDYPNLVFVMLSMFFTSACVLLCVHDISKSTQRVIRKLGLTTMAVCLFTTAFLYGPLVVYMVTHQKLEQAFVDAYSDIGTTQWGTMALSVSSLRVLADPALCVLACREIPRQLHSLRRTFRFVLFESCFSMGVKCDHIRK